MGAQGSHPTCDAQTTTTAGPIVKATGTLSGTSNRWWRQESKTRRSTPYSMGYYSTGYSSSRGVQELSALERLLRQLAKDGTLETLDVLERIARSVVQNHPEYRSLRVDSDALTALFRVPCAVDTLGAMGWERDGETLVLPASIKLDFQTHVVSILEAKRYQAKLIEDNKKSAKRAADPKKAELLRQVALDRQEQCNPQQASALAPTVSEPVTKSDTETAPVSDAAPCAPSTGDTAAAPDAGERELDELRALRHRKFLETFGKTSGGLSRTPVRALETKVEVAVPALETKVEAAVTAVETKVEVAVPALETKVELAPAPETEVAPVPVNTDVGALPSSTNEREVPDAKRQWEELRAEQRRRFEEARLQEKSGVFCGCM